MGMLFFLYPFAEIYAWSQVVADYGWGEAFLWCFYSAILGMCVISLLVGRALRELQASAALHQRPSSRTIHNLVMCLGGLLLILPGFISDFVGALLIMPGSRHLIIWWVGTKAKGKLASTINGFGAGGPLGGFSFRMGGMGPQQSRVEPRDVTPAARDVIDVRATLIEDKKKD